MRLLGALLVACLLGSCSLVDHAVGTGFVFWRQANHERGAASFEAFRAAERACKCDPRKPGGPLYKKRRPA